MAKSNVTTTEVISNPDDPLSDETTQRIKTNITQAGLTALHKTLMKFIQGGIGCDGRQANPKPRYFPSRLLPATQGPKQKKAQNKIFRHVCKLANDVIKKLERLRRNLRPKPAENCGKNMPGVFTGKIGG